MFSSGDKRPFDGTLALWQTFSSQQINLDSMQGKQERKALVSEGPLVLEDGCDCSMGCSLNPGLALRFPLIPLIRSLSHPGILYLL